MEGTVFSECQENPRILRFEDFEVVKTENNSNIQESASVDLNNGDDFTNVEYEAVSDPDKVSDVKHFTMAGASTPTNIDDIITGDIQQDVMNTQNLQSHADSATSDASYSQISQARRLQLLDYVMFPDKENVITEDWTGLYDFNVTPIVTSKKVIFDPDMNKLFTTINTSVPFRIEVALDKITDLNDLTVRANLTFLDHDLKTRPVLRCFKHVGEDQHLSKTDDSVRIQHVLRPSVEGEARYVQNKKTKHCYLTFKLNSPEPGVQYMQQFLKFACLNSCSTNPTGRSSANRDIGLLFVLYGQIGGGGLQAVGRRFIKLRVCAAPVRDHLREKESHRCKRARIEYDHQPDKQSSSSSWGTKQPRTLVPPSRSQTSDGHSRTAEETKLTSSPQVFPTAQLQELKKDVAWTLEQNDSQSVVMREYSSIISGSLYMIQNLCNNARKFALDAAEDQDEQNVNERSPNNTTGE